LEGQDIKPRNTEKDKEQPLSLLAKERRLQYVGHVIQQMALNWTPQGGKE